MLLLILLFGCISKHTLTTSTLGVVDIKNGNSCEINLDAENIGTTFDVSVLSFESHLEPPQVVCVVFVYIITSSSWSYTRSFLTLSGIWLKMYSKLSS